MENSDFIYPFIELVYRNKLNRQQQEELQAWLDLSPDHISEYNEIIKLFRYADRLVAMKKIETGRDLLTVRKKLKRDRTISRVLLNFQRIAAILIIPLLIYTAWSLFDLPGSRHESGIMKSTETAFGIRSQILLPDGTKVWLNSGSKLIYPERFTGKSREVRLTGEAYFQVSADREHPFYVDLDGYKVKATGTSFNISCYPDEKEILTYLEHGKVSLLIGKDGTRVQTVPLGEKETMIMDRNEKGYRIQRTEGGKYLAWIDGMLILKNDDIHDVAVRLGRWYNAEVTFDDELARSGYIFTATFKKESLEEALELLSYSSPITYRIIPGIRMDDSSFSKRKVILSKR